jgi:valyl-tRNA synthetase
LEGGVVDAEAIDAFELFQSTVRSIRNARAEYEVEPGKKIQASVVTSSPSLCRYFTQERQSLALLAKLDGDTLQITEGVVKKERGADAKRIELVVKEGLEVVLPLAGLFDPAKEIDRLQKQGEKISKELEGLEKRLSNKNFVDKAPENVVAEVKAAAKELGDQLAVINEKIAGFS